MTVTVNINHDTSTTLNHATNYTHVYNPGSDISITPDAAYPGTTNGLKIIVDDADLGALGKDVAKSGTVRFRIYIKPSTVALANGETIDFLYVRQNSVGELRFAKLTLTWKSADSNYYVQGRAYNDAGATQGSAEAEIGDGSAWHYIEANVVSSTGVGDNNGTFEWWVDGVSQETRSSIDNYNRMQDLDWHLQVGDLLISIASPSGSLFLDELVANDDGGEIGPTPIVGETCWGHDTGVVETNVRNFTGNWTGTGAITGVGDAERLELDAGEYMISEVVNTGVRHIELDQNHYAAGDNVNMDYRHGADKAACEAAAWNDYSAPFESLGYVQIRVTSTL